MTDKEWKRLSAVIEMGDPIKDVADDSELIEYILELRERLNLPPDKA
jgi:hypothetical protein